MYVSYWVTIPFWSGFATMGEWRNLYKVRSEQTYTPNHPKNNAEPEHGPVEEEIHKLISTPSRQP